MNVVTLATRMIARRRRMMLRSAIPLGFAAFVLVTAAAVVETVGLEVRELERTEMTGELQMKRTAGPDELTQLVAGISSPEVLISHAWVAPAIVTGPWGNSIAEVWFTDINQELAFRDLPMPSLQGGLVGTGGDVPPGSGLTLTIPGFKPIQTTVAQTADLAEPDTLIMLPWNQLPEVRGQDPTVGTEVIRLRGVEPLDARELEHWAVETGLGPSGWESNVWRRMRDLWWFLAALTGLLYIAGGTATAPSVGIMVRRYSTEFELLSATGYPRAYIRRLVATIGAITAALAAAVGSVAGSVVISIASVRGGIDPSFLPLYWLETNPTLGVLAPQPPIVPAVIAVGLATVVGGISALPSARRAATIGSHGELWR
ncbi:MAG: FtsX-like permease family protein [Spirochaetia bacterium]